MTTLVGFRRAAAADAGKAGIGGVCSLVHERRVALGHLRAPRMMFDAVAMDPVISHADVTTIMRLIGDIHRDVERIRVLLEENDGEEEEDSEADI